MRKFDIGDFITSIENEHNDPQFTFKVVELSNDLYVVENIDNQKRKVEYVREDYFKKIKPLKPFDHVLVRDSIRDEWVCAIYSHYSTQKGRFICSGDIWIYCIPYDGNEELVGKKG